MNTPSAVAAYTVVLILLAWPLLRKVITRRRDVTV
ncbi:tripartite tricarboxylate transporter TctA [Streptomyces narbonensis]